jgi:hypothetical protein
MSPEEWISIRVSPEAVEVLIMLEVMGGDQLTES